MRIGNLISASQESAVVFMPIFPTLVSSLLNGITYRPLVLNFIQIRKQMRKLQVEVH